MLLDNDGGGIFHFLPVERRGRRLRASTSPRRTGSTSRTPPRSTGCGYERVADADGFRAALDDALAARIATIIEVRTDRAENVALHRRVWQAVAQSVRGGA